MIEINLLPVDEDVQAKAAQKGLGFEVPKFIPRGFGIAVVLLLAMYALSNLRASSASKNLENTRQTLSDLRRLSTEAQSIEAKLPSLRERASIFQTRLEGRKLWSQILQEVTLCCPEEVQLAKIELSVPRSGSSTTQRPKELLIKGFYAAGGNLENREMVFKDNLQRNETISNYYHNFIAMTEPQAAKTDFTIRCTEQ